MTAPFTTLKLQGVMCEEHAGSLIITRRVLERPSLLARPDGYSPPMEKAAVLPAGTWNGCFFYPEGAKDDKTSFMTWAVLVRDDLVDLVKTSCQPRPLVEDGKDQEKLTEEVKELLTESGIVLATKMP